MLDEDIKKLLVELNMTHLVEEIEKISQVAVPQEITVVQESPVEVVLSKIILSKSVVDEEMTEEEQELEAAKRLQKQVQQVNAQLVTKKSYLKRFGVFLSLLFIVGSSVGYFTWHTSSQEQPSEVVVEKKATDPVVEVKIELGGEALKVAKDTLTKLLDERKIALIAAAKEMDALIVMHGDKKQDSFASKLTALTAKCQAIDEEYSVKIAHEIRQLKQNNNAEFAEPFAQLVTSLNW